MPPPLTVPSLFCMPSPVMIQDASSLIMPLERSVLSLISYVRVPVKRRRRVRKRCSVSYGIWVPRIQIIIKQPSRRWNVRVHEWATGWLDCWCLLNIMQHFAHWSLMARIIKFSTRKNSYSQRNCSGANCAIFWCLVLQMQCLRDGDVWWSSLVVVVVMEMMMMVSMAAGYRLHWGELRVDLFIHFLKAAAVQSLIFFSPSWILWSPVGSNLVVTVCVCFLRHRHSPYWQI